MKKNLRVFVSSFMVGVMTATSTGIPGLSAVSAFAAEDGVVDEVESPAAAEVAAPAEADGEDEEEASAPIAAFADFEALAGNTWSADDLSGAVTKGTALLDNDDVTVTAGQDLDWVADAGTQIEQQTAGFGSQKYTNHVVTTSENTSIDGANYRIAIEFTAKKNGTVTLDTRVGKGKNNFIFEKDGDTYTQLDQYPADATAGVDECYTATVNVEEGKTYVFAGKGTNPFFYGFSMEAEKAAIADETWTADNATADTAIAKGTALIDGELGTVTVGQDLNVVADAGDQITQQTAGFGSQKYTNHVVTTGENTSIDGANYRVVLEVTAKADMKVSMDTRVGKGKNNFVFLKSGDTYTQVSQYPADATAENDACYTENVTLKAGETMVFAGKGTNPFFYGITLSDNSGAADFGDLATPEAGKTYVADFSAIGSEEANVGMAVDGVKYGSDTIGAVAPGGSYIHGKHGVATKPGDSLKLAVAGDAKISLVACVYGRSTFTLTDPSGNVIGTFYGKNSEAPGHESEADGSETAQVIDYKGPAGVLTLTFDPAAAGESYVHSVSVANAALAIGEAEDFELWFDDIAQDVENGKDTDGNPVIMKTFAQQEIKYGDSVVKLVGSGEESFTPNNNNAAFMNLTRNGRVVNAYKAGPRFAKTLTEAPVDINDQPIYMDAADPTNLNYNANNIPVIPDYGDGTALEFTCVANGTFVAYVYTGSFIRIWDFDSKTGKRIGYTDSDTGVEFVAFQAEAGHTYVLSTTGKTNNCGFCGVEYAVDNEIEVPIDKNGWKVPEDATYNFDKSTFTLVDAFLGTTVAKIDKNTTSVKLNANHTYNVVSADPGVGVTFVNNDLDSIKLTSDVKELQLSLVEIPDVLLSGDIMTSDGAEHDLKSVKFVNTVSGNEYTAQLVGKKFYTVSVKPGDYYTVIESDKYTTIDKVKVLPDQKNENLIYLKAIDDNFIDMTKDIVATEGQRFTYVNNSGKMGKNNDTSIKAQAGDKIIIPVEGNGKKQKVTVAGWYSGTWDINGQNSVKTSSSANASNPNTNCYFTDGTETSVTVNLTGEGVTNYLYWVKIEDVVEFTPTITVPGPECTTLKDANNYIARMYNRPEGEAGRVTIELAADFEEQIVFDQPYTTVNGNGHTISWYYGVGSFYYSINKGTGLFDIERFYDKYESNEADGNLWGGVAIIRGDHFITNNTIYKNTYNYEVTETDAADFEHSIGGVATDRTPGADVAYYKAKERSNAFYINADDIQIYNCQILSSQDTFGRNGSANNNYHVYVADSTIGGNVDYICGEFTAVFDNCQLQWKTYSDSNNDKIGYITAAKTSPYVFRNCVITSDDSQVTPKGAYGRTWGKDSNAAFLFTQTNGTINEDGWGEMSAGDSATAKFYDYANFNGDDDAAPAAKYASELTGELEEAYTTDEGIIDILTFTPVNFRAEAANTINDSGDYAAAPAAITVKNASADIPTATYEIGNDTILIAAVKELSSDPLTFKSAAGKVIATSDYVYDSIALADGYTITSKDLGVEDGYLYAVRVVGVRSAYMSAEGNKAREDNVDGFSAEFGIVPEVADEAKEVEVVSVEGTPTVG